MIIDLEEISVTQHLPLFKGVDQIGTLRSACYSPDYGKCLGIAMIDKIHQTLDQDLKLLIKGIEISAKMTNLPFTK
jgi:dimethylsulfoniopropionate demethylase